MATGRRSPALFAPRASDPARGRSPQPPAGVPAVSRVTAQAHTRRDGSNWTPKTQRPAG